MKSKTIVSLISLISALFIVGCAGMVMEYTPIKSDDGQKGYFVRTVYGLIDGTKKQAIKEIEREANRLCPNGFAFVSEEEHPRKTKWGAENGQVDLVWEVMCTNA